MNTLSPQQPQSMMLSGPKRLSLLRRMLSIPSIHLNPRQLCDVELLLNGAFAPLNGFLTQQDYERVVSSMRLESGTFWPMPIVLDVDDVSELRVGSPVALLDEYGKPIAQLNISSMYAPDKQKEALSVYGTKSLDHPGIRTLMSRGKWYIGGSITGVNPVDRFDFISYRQTPDELKTWFAKHHWSTIIGFQTRNPLHRIHVEMIRAAVREFKGNVLIHPSVGVTKEGDIDYITRVRCYIALLKYELTDSYTLRLLPLAMRMAGPREALWHALIRKNYGCTHFVVGRDHAGPGADRDGVSFYGPYEAQEMAVAHSKEMGITIIPYKEMAYVVGEKKYMFVDKIPKKAKVNSISGTKLRSLIRSGEPVPSWISFPEVISELRRGIQKEKKDGLTVFFTGLPCAGKSTLARIVFSKLMEDSTKHITFLDGDVVRQHLSKGLGFSKEDRNINIKRIGFVASEITKHGGLVICSAVAPYEEIRAYNRALISTYGTYIEVYVSTPIGVCKTRDIKGLYKKGSLGQVKGITGVDDPYEIPKHPEITINASRGNPYHHAKKIINYLKKLKLIQEI